MLDDGNDGTIPSNRCYFAMGTIGFLSSYLFVYYIFKAVKSD